MRYLILLLKQKVFYILIAVVYIISSAMSYNREHNADKLAAYYGTPIENKATEEVIEFAREQLGKPYQYGGKGPNRFDCSGLTRYVFSEIDITLGASSRDQALQGRRIAKDQLISGDLVFFKAAGLSSNNIDHVGIVVATSDTAIQFIHSTSEGVMIDDLKSSGYYSDVYVTGRRILNIEE